MNKQLEKAALALREAIHACPEADRDYLVNFVVKNAHRPAAEMVTRMKADRGGREEAEKIQRHRDEKVLGDALEAAKRLGIEVAITGVAAGTKTEHVKAKG